MMKKTVTLLFVLISCGFVFAVPLNIFDGGGDGTIWSDPNNWSLGHAPIYNTDSSEYSYIGRDAAGDLNIIIDDSHARGGKAWLGRPEDPAFTYTLNLVDDAYYYLVRLYIGPRGVLIQDAGEFDTWEGRFDGAEITINDGLFTVRSNWWGFFANATPGKGVTTINGGTLRIKNGTTFSRLTDASHPYNPEFTGVWDLRGGQVVMDGDVRSELQWHINHGNIVAYGGTDPDYVPEPVYSTSTKQTTLKAVLVNKWTGDGDGSTWHDPNNWSLGILPTYNTDHSMLTYVGMGATGDYDVTITKDLENDGMRAHSGRVWLGRPEDPSGTYTLNIPVGGEYYLVRHYIGPKGVLNIDGGMYNAWEGRYDACQININSGTFIVRGPLWNFFNGSVTTINGGMLRIQNGDDFSYYADGIETRNPNFTGTWDLCGGKIVMDGDCRTALQWHIDNGNIIAYGGTDPDFELEMIYNPAINTTTINSNTTAVKNTWPADGMTLTMDDRQTIQLNWKPGRDVENLDGYNVYIADPNIPDPNLIALTLVSDPIVPYTGTSWQVPVLPGETYTWRVDAVTDDGTNIIPGEVWSVTIDDELLTLYTGGHLNSTLDYQWIGCGDGTSWNDALNWHSEYPEPNLAIPTYPNHEGDLIESRMEGTITTWWSTGGTFFLGYGVDQTVNVSSPGTLWQLYRFYNYTDGTVNIAPDCTAHWVRLDNNGGTVNVDGRLELIGPGWYIRQIADKGGINVLEGEVVFREMPENFPFEEGESGNIDIYEGTVVIDCNDINPTGDIPTVQGWINDGYIVGYGGQENSIVDLYYDAEVEAIYLTARQDQRKAYYPVPFDGEQDFGAGEPLSWMVGTDVTEETLYLSKALRADLTGDDVVDIDDLLMFAANYLDDSWLAIDKADITDDYEVNLRDLAVISGEWQDVLTLAEVDTVIHGAGFNADEPFSYAVSLDADTDYVWRVDGTVTSDTWTFKTAADPMLAYNEYPVNGDQNVVSGTVQLAWETDSAIDNCNVYFGDSYNALTYQTNNNTGTWTSPALTVGQKYYWRIDTVDGSTVRTGKVWTFTVTSTPLGLYVESGTLKHDGVPFKGYGVNYINPFHRCVQDPTDTSYKRGFSVLGEKNIPFVRMWAGGFHVSDWNMYFEDKEQYFAIFDDVMASAEENNVGVIFSMFWSWYVLPDVVGEHVSAWGDANSETSKFMETYIRELYDRYKNCPSFWGWELGNEYNLAAERNTLAAKSLLPVYQHPTTLDSIHPVSRDNTLDRIDMTLLRQIATNFYAAVRKVDKNRMVTNGLSLRLDPSSSTPDYGQPEREIDHEMVDVVSIHYYGHTDNGATPSVLYAAVTDTASWGQPLFVGEFGVSESADLNEVHDGGYASVEEAIADMVNDMVTHGVTFACAWVYDFSEQNQSFEIRSNNTRGYVLDLLSNANASMNP